MLLFEMALRQNAESLGWQPSWVFSFFFFFWLGSGLYAAGGSPTEPDADSQTSFSFSFLDLICTLSEAPTRSRTPTRRPVLLFWIFFSDFWIFGFYFLDFLDFWILFFGFFGFYFDFDHGTIIAVALGTRDPIVVTRLLTGEAVGER